MSSIHKRCRGRWFEILTYAGIDGSVLDGKHHKCPGCGGVDRFRYKRDDDGGFFCGDTRANGIDLLMHVKGVDFRGACDIAEEVVGKDDRPRERELTFSERLLSRAEPLRVSRYLERRGLSVPSGLQCIRRLPYYEDGREVGEYPAILSPIKQGDSFRAYHATYLSRGKKAEVPKPRKVLPGKSITGGAIQLDGMPGNELGVAEGIETALAARSVRSRGPVWSVLSTSGMRSFIWPKHIKELTIFADHDRNLAGHAAAFHLAHRALLDGVRVRIICPNIPGEDMNDVLLNQSGISVLYEENP